MIFTIVLGSNHASALRGFLKRNRVALLLDVSRGGGDILYDFAKVLGIDPRDHRLFGKRMRFFRKRVRGWIVRPPQKEEDFMLMVRWLKKASKTGEERG